MELAEAMEDPVTRAHAEDLISELDRDGLFPRIVIKHFLIWQAAKDHERRVR